MSHLHPPYDVYKIKKRFICQLGANNFLSFWAWNHWFMLTWKLECIELFCCIDFSHPCVKTLSYQGHPIGVGLSMKSSKTFLPFLSRSEFLNHYHHLVLLGDILVLVIAWNSYRVGLIKQSNFQNTIIRVFFLILSQSSLDSLVFRYIAFAIAFGSYQPFSHQIVLLSSSKINRGCVSSIFW